MWHGRARLCGLAVLLLARRSVVGLCGSRDGRGRLCYVNDSRGRLCYVNDSRGRLCYVNDSRGRLSYMAWLSHMAPSLGSGDDCSSPNNCDD